MIGLLDELAANAWPAPVVQVVDGWQLRYGWGVTSRANSVLPSGAGELPLEERLALAEGFYARRGVPARFQLSPACRPADLDAVLADRGYVVATPTLVHVAALEPPPGSPAASVRLAEAPDPTWLDVWGRGEGRALTLDVVEPILARIGPEAAYALAELDGRPAAAGRAVLERGWLGIFGMATLPDARRRGLARALLAALAAWGVVRGATRAYLMVEEGNAPARSLYEQAGFELLYGYHYRVQEETPC